MERDILQDLAKAYALDRDAHATIRVDGATTYDGPIAELPLPVVLMADYSRECGHIVEVRTNAAKSNGGKPDFSDFPPIPPKNKANISIQHPRGVSD